jgi:hypothetical protein
LPRKGLTRRSHEPAERRLGIGGPPEQPLIDLRLLGGIRRREAVLGALGREVFEDRRGFPQHDPVVLERRDATVGIPGEVLRRAQLALLEIERDPIERNAELGRQQAHLVRVRGALSVVELDRHGLSCVIARRRAIPYPLACRSFLPQHRQASP